MLSKEEKIKWLIIKIRQKEEKLDIIKTSPFFQTEGGKNFQIEKNQKIINMLNALKLDLELEE